MLPGEEQRVDTSQALSTVSGRVSHCDTSNQTAAGIKDASVALSSWWVNTWRPLTIVGLSGDGALSGWVPVLVPPLPVDAADDPRPRDDVLHHLGTEQAALATKVCFCLLHSFTCKRGARATESVGHQTCEEIKVPEASVSVPSWSSQTAVTEPYSSSPDRDR